MKNAIVTVAMFALVSSQACSADGNYNQRRSNTTIVSVLANPGNYEGKTITVDGFLGKGGEFENQLFLDKNSFINELYDRSIAIPFNASPPEVVAKHYCSYVMVTGRYTASRGVSGVGQLIEVIRVLPIKQSTCTD